jgi:urease accessory protein
MQRAKTRFAADEWDRLQEVGTVTLSMAERQRRRVKMRDDEGGDFLLDLARPAFLRDGDGLELSGGGLLRVIAAAEPVCEVRCADSAQLARLAWHLGNRHHAVQVVDGQTLRFADDHVLAAMVQGLGGQVDHTHAAFQPEGGAYEGHGH